MGLINGFNYHMQIFKKSIRHACVLQSFQQGIDLFSQNCVQLKSPEITKQTLINL